MSDFYSSRFRAVYYCDEGTTQVCGSLAEYGDLLSGEPTREWSAETASHSLERASAAATVELWPGEEVRASKEKGEQGNE